MARTRNRAREIVKAVDHDEAHLIGECLKLFAATVGSLDGLYPNPEARGHAKKATALADEFVAANMARQFLEGDE